jgi:hypothetical protein
MSVTVYSNSILTKILNTDLELSAFPIEGQISLLFSNYIDKINIKSYIFLIRAKPRQDVINISFTDVRNIGDINVDYYDVVDYTYTETLSVDTSNPGIVYLLSPAEPLLPNNDYFIVVSKSLSSQYHGSEKTTSIGPSSISLNVAATANPSDLVIDTVATYTINITTTSVIANGTHVIGYTLLKDNIPVVTNQTLEIRSQTLFIDTGITVSFSPNIPFINGEVFKVYLTGFNRQNITQVQKIITYIDTDLIQEPVIEQSQRINQKDIINFYETYGYARRLANPTGVLNPADPPLANNQVKAVIDFDFVFPGTIYIKLDMEIDPATISANAFNITLAPAFDNIFLAQLGNYMSVPDYISATKYVFAYKLVSDDDGLMNTIRLNVTQDVTNQVPSNVPYIVILDPN